MLSRAALRPSKASSRKSLTPRSFAPPSHVLVNATASFLTRPLEEHPCLILGVLPSIFGNTPLSGWLLYSDLAGTLQKYTVRDSRASPLTIFSLHPRTDWPGALSSLTLFLPCDRSNPSLSRSVVSVPIMSKLSYIAYTPQYSRLPLQLEPVSSKVRRRTAE